MNQFSSSNPELLCQQAVDFHKRGNLAEAEHLYVRVLALAPGHFMASHSLGVIRLSQGRHDEAVALIGAALAVQPQSVAALANYGLALQEAGRAGDALASFDAALALAAGHPDLL